MKSPLLQGLLSRYVADGAGGEGSTPPRYRPATQRLSVESSDARDVPSGSAAAPGRSTPSRRGKPVNDGQPIKATPPRHGGGRQLSLDMKRKPGGLSSIHANSPSNRTRNAINSTDKTPKAGTNRLRVSATSSGMTKKGTSPLPPTSSNVSPLLRQAHSLRKKSLTPPKMVQHVPRMSFEAVPESLDLFSAASLETIDTLSTMGLTFSGSASTDGAGFCDDGHNDDFTMVASVLSTSAIASSLNSGESDDGATSQSKKEPSLHYKKPRGSRSRLGGAIVNMEEVKSTQADHNKNRGVVDATSLLASLNIDTSRASQAEIALLTKVIGKLANDEDSGSIQTEGICDAQSVTSFLSQTSTSSRRQELERLKLLKLNSSVAAKKEIRQKETTKKATENARRGTVTRNAINRATAKASTAKSSITDPVEAFRALSPSSGKAPCAKKSLSRSELRLASSHSREAIKPAETDNSAANRGRSISRSRSILLRSTPRSRAVEESKTAKPPTQSFRERSFSRTRSNLARLPSGTNKQPSTTKTEKPPTQTFRGRSLSRTRSSVGRSPSPTISKVMATKQPSTPTKPVSPKFRGRSVSRTRQKLGAGSTTIVASTSPPRGALNRHCPSVPNAATNNRAERRKKRLSPPRP